MLHAAAPGIGGELRQLGCASAAQPRQPTPAQASARKAFPPVHCAAPAPARPPARPPTSLPSGTGGQCGKRKPMRSASASPSSQVAAVGVPITAAILASSSGCRAAPPGTAGLGGRRQWLAAVAGGFFAWRTPEWSGVGAGRVAARAPATASMRRMCEGCTAGRGQARPAVAGQGGQSARAEESRERAGRACGAVQCSAQQAEWCHIRTPQRSATQRGTAPTSELPGKSGRSM